MAGWESRLQAGESTVERKKEHTCQSNPEPGHVFSILSTKVYKSAQVVPSSLGSGHKEAEEEERGWERGAGLVRKVVEEVSPVRGGVVHVRQNVPLRHDGNVTLFLQPFQGPLL